MGWSVELWGLEEGRLGGADLRGEPTELGDGKCSFGPQSIVLERTGKPMTVRFLYDGCPVYDRPMAVPVLRAGSKLSCGYLKISAAELRRRAGREAATCECGSGSDLAGPGHSHWCRMWREWKAEKS